MKHSERRSHTLTNEETAGNGEIFVPAPWTQIELSVCILFETLPCLSFCVPFTLLHSALFAFCIIAVLRNCILCYLRYSVMMRFALLCYLLLA